MKEKEITIDPKTRIIDLTVGELLELIGKPQTVVRDFTPASGKRFEYGIAGIMNIFNCSRPTACRYKKIGIIDRAISQSFKGSNFTVDVDLALELMRISKECN